MRKLKATNLSVSGRIPEQQRNDMFKTMNNANKNSESYEPITFEELQNNMIKKGGTDAEMVLTMRNQHEERMKEICDLCGKSNKEHDSRGFIYFHGGDDHLKAGWSCVEELVRKNKITIEKPIENKKPTKIERDIRNNDRSLEGWCNIILGK